MTASKIREKQRKKSQANALYSSGSSVQRAVLALWIRGCIQPQNIPIIAYSWGNWGMGLLKRDLARASAEPQPELGGASCPLTAPLHLQKHAASLQQLAKGCARETLLPHILPLLYYMAILLPRQLAERHSRAAPLLHPACWPATLAPCLWYIYIYLSALPSWNSISLFCETLAHIQTFWGNSDLSKTLQMSLLSLVFLFGVEKGRCLEILWGDTFSKPSWAWYCTVLLLDQRTGASVSLCMLSRSAWFIQPPEENGCLVFFLCICRVTQ